MQLSAINRAFLCIVDIMLIDFKKISVTVYRIEYRKIPNISPGLIEVRKHILGGLYSGGAYIRGAYIRRAFCVSV